MGRKVKKETHEEWHENLRARFEKYCEKASGNGCWIWTGAEQKKGGQYAMLNLGTRHNGISKGAYEPLAQARDIILGKLGVTKPIGK